MVIQYVQLRDKLKINTVNFRIKDSNQIYRLILDVLGLSRTKNILFLFLLKEETIDYWKGLQREQQQSAGHFHHSQNHADNINC